MIRSGCVLVSASSLLSRSLLSSQLSATMGSFPIAEAQLTALFMQSIAYGIHTVTFAACMYTWFLRAATQGSVLWVWMSIAIAFFVIGTCDVALNFYHNLAAFVFSSSNAGGANAVFDQSSSWISILRVGYL